MAGTIGLVQNDIKRVLAYSTVSQLGYMFLAMGVGAYAAGIFHLYTHAFFKALLFLGSGAVIHALARRTGSAADGRAEEGAADHLLDVPRSARWRSPASRASPGFFSKDEILFRTFASGHTMLWVVGLLTSLLTAIYMFRLVFLAFHGPSHALGRAGERRRARAARAPIRTAAHRAAPAHHHLHDAPPAMALALIVLAVGSVVAGYAGCRDPRRRRLVRALTSSRASAPQPSKRWPSTGSSDADAGVDRRSRSPASASRCTSS